MAGTRKWAVIAAIGGVWVTAVSSAAALTYDLNRPLRSPSVTWHHAPRLAARPNTSIEAVVEPISEPGTVIEVPTITVVAEPVERRTAAAPKAAADISQMRCTAWRELDIGSGHVRVCE